MKALAPFLTALMVMALVVFTAWMSGWDFTRGEAGGMVTMFAIHFGVVAAIATLELLKKEGK